MDILESSPTFSGAIHVRKVPMNTGLEGTDMDEPGWNYSLRSCTKFRISVSAHSKRFITSGLHSLSYGLKYESADSEQIFKAD